MPQHLIEMIGRRFEHLLVISRDEQPSKKPRWICQCDCGVTKSVSGALLRRGEVRSCGCLLIDINNGKRRYDKPIEEMGEYSSWCGMKKRCLNPNAPNYPDYGGRGITIDPRWIDSFDNFYADMGPKPDSTYSIERNDNDGNYTLSNCRWATRQEQILGKTPNGIQLWNRSEDHVSPDRT